jgi:hypothetical protein
MEKQTEMAKKGTLALHEALAKKGLKISEKELEEAVKAAHKAATVGCDSCANGWSW